MLTAAALTLALMVTLAPPGAVAQTPTPRMRLVSLVDAVRHRHGLPSVRVSRSLRRAAQAHCQDMVVHHYFAHTSPTGVTLYLRIVRSGFVTHGVWSAGETLAWGTGVFGRPRRVVRMWLRSREHRAILLSARYRWIGVGRAVGTVLGHRDAVVWTADWGHR